MPNSDAILVLAPPWEEVEVTEIKASVPVACGAGADAVEIVWLVGLKGVLGVGAAVTKPGAGDARDGL